MKTARFCIYSLLLGIGSAVIGFVIGLLIEQPTAAISSILTVIGIFFAGGAILLARRYRKRPDSGL
jgi:ABC-type Mn2+/Zn2+ transport system permease subunit